MLTNVSPIAVKGNLAAIFAILGQSGEPQILSKGIILVPHFNGVHVLPGEWEEWPKLNNKDVDLIEAMSDDNWTNCYGVCDDVQQLLDRCPMLINDPDRKFVITLTEVRRDNQPSEGGWRWHKWGPYIGNKEPQCEYLYDEKDIEQVFCYHVLEQK